MRNIEYQESISKKKIIELNTVPSENQMVNSSDVFFLGNKTASKKILIVGNSITRHGPKADIGWYGDWGMAASSPEKDYVHRLSSLFRENCKDVYIRVSQCAFWERNFLNTDILDRYKADKDFKCDVLIFRLGENVSSNLKPFFKDSLLNFINYIKCDKTKMLFSTCFWENDSVDKDIRQVADVLNSHCVELGDLGNESSMRATGKFFHTGVAAHPGDKGMEIIAQRLYEQLKKII